MQQHTVLITGGAGFIGSNLTRALVARGHAVRILDNLSPQIHGEAPDLSALEAVATVTRGDVRDRDAVAAALEGVTAVVHLAAETGTGQSMYEIHRYVDVNVSGTSILLDLLANQPHTVRKLVVASSRSIYGEGRYLSPEHGYVYPTERADADMAAGRFEPVCPVTGGPLTLVPTDEDSRIHPSSIYGVTKYAQERLVLSAGASLGIPAIALRYQNVYGPGQSLKNPYTGILSVFSTRLRNGNGVSIFEDGEESRDFVFIDDVVAATVLAVENQTVTADVFNVGYGESVSVNDVARHLRDALGAEGEITVTGNYRLGDIRHNVADISRARAALGFEPAVPFAEGVRRFADWVLTQPVEADNYDRSISEMKAKGLYK